MKRAAANLVMMSGLAPLLPLLLLLLLLSPWSSRAQELDCSFQDSPLLLMNDLLSFQHIVNDVEGTITVELTYYDVGWVAFGLQPNGEMIGGEVVIAKPLRALGSTNPGKYVMSAESESGVSLMSQQTLINATFEQTESETILRYTKLLSEDGELSIDPSGGVTFIYAAGKQDSFADHGFRVGSTYVDTFSKCRVLSSSTSAPTTGGTSGGGTEDDGENGESEGGNGGSTSGGSGSGSGSSNGGSGSSNGGSGSSNGGSGSSNGGSGSSSGGSGSSNGGDENENESSGGEGSSSGGNGDSNSSTGGSVNPNGNSTSVSTGGIAGALDCAFRNDVPLQSGLYSLKQIVNDAEGTMTVEFTFNGEGWLAFGVSPNGAMIGGEVVIAKTAEAPSSSNPAKYSMSGESADAVTLMASQTLVNASFEQTNGQTILRYTKLLKESGEIEIASDASNTFIYASGVSNDFADHQQYKGSVTLNSLTKCVATGSSDPGSNSTNQDLNSSASASEAAESKSRNLWVFHGILMAVSWAILLPIGIGCSLLRSLIPGQGVWFKIHMFCNGTAFLLMTAAFGVAVYNTNSARDVHFDSKHKAIGLAVYVVSFVQVLAGIFRPHLPKPSPAERRDSTDEEDLKDLDNQNMQSSAEEAPPKSSARIAFEIGHRLVGFTLLGLAWYNCYTGIEEMTESYGDSYDKTTALWGVIGGLSGVILLLYIYQLFARKQ